MFLGLEGYTNEMVAICILISIVAAFAYVYRKRVKSEYTGALLGNSKVAKKEKPKKKINPQGTKSDYLQLLSGLVSIARRKNWLIFAPAVVEADGAYTQLVALLVTPHKIIGVCGFGHGGTMVAGAGLQDWTQRINDTEQKISSPLKTIANAEKILQSACARLGIQGHSVQVLGGFTHPHASLQGAAAKTCYTSADLMAMLQDEAEGKEKDEQIKAVAEQLRTVVIKPEKTKK